MSAFWVDLDAKVITQGPVRSWERIINDVARSSSVLEQIPARGCASLSADAIYSCWSHDRGGLSMQSCSMWAGPAWMVRMSLGSYVVFRVNGLVVLGGLVCKTGRAGVKDRRAVRGISSQDRARGGRGLRRTSANRVAFDAILITQAPKCACTRVRLREMRCGLLAAVI